MFEKKLAKERQKGPDKPKKKFLKKFDLQETTQDGYKVFTISPKTGKTSNHHVLYLHGGGYVLDLAWAHWDFVGRLIEATGATVTLPIYPLAPDTKCAELTPAMQKLFERIATEHGAGFRAGEEFQHREPLGGGLGIGDGAVAGEGGGVATQEVADDLQFGVVHGEGAVVVEVGRRPGGKVNHRIVIGDGSWQREFGYP